MRNSCLLSVCYIVLTSKGHISQNKTAEATNTAARHLQFQQVGQVPNSRRHGIVTSSACYNAANACYCASHLHPAVESFTWRGVGKVQLVGDAEYQ
jgi:hypothetical protein